MKRNPERGKSWYRSHSGNTAQAGNQFLVIHDGDAILQSPISFSGGGGDSSGSSIVVG